MDAPFNLYFLDPNTTKVRKVVDNVAYPSSLSWSPDGRWLAFGASSVPGMTGGGTWLFSPPSGKFYRVSDKIMVQVVWSPDGTRLVGSWQAGTGSFPIQTQLFMFDVEGLLNSTK